MHEPLSFRPRLDCPSCSSASSKCLLATSYSDPRISEFVAAYYGGAAVKERLARALYEVRQCSCCGLLWQVHVPNETAMRELYGTWISSEESLKKKREAHGSLFVRYARQVESIQRLIGDKPHEKRVLDFGMGWGYWCLMAKAFGYNVVGLELSEERLRHATSLGIETACDARSLSKISFDFINSEQVFEHLPEPAAVLAQLVDLLKPGGVVRIAVPDGSKAAHELKRKDWKASKGPTQPLEHINCFSPESLLRFAERVGITPIPSYLRYAHLPGVGRLFRKIADIVSPYSWRTRIYFRKGMVP